MKRQFWPPMTGRQTDRRELGPARREVALPIKAPMYRGIAVESCSLLLADSWRRGKHEFGADFNLRGRLKWFQTRAGEILTLGTLYFVGNAWLKVLLYRYVVGFIVFVCLVVVVSSKPLHCWCCYCCSRCSCYCCYQFS